MFTIRKPIPIPSPVIRAITKVRAAVSTLRFCSSLTLCMFIEFSNDLSRECYSTGVASRIRFPELALLLGHHPRELAFQFVKVRELLFEHFGSYQILQSLQM